MGTGGGAPAGAPLALALVGDVMLGRGVARAMEVYGPDHPLGAVRPLLAQGDLVFANLECALTGRATRGHDGPDKSFYFRADRRYVEALRRGGIDVVSLANNHVADFGPRGLLDTVDALDHVGIAHAGAGTDLRIAATPARLVRKQWRVSLLAFADHPAAWAAGPSTPGIRFLPIDAVGLARARDAIVAERPHADIVVVSLHWGPNMVARPSPSFRAFARGLVEAGADLVWGHSAHVVQGMEWVRGRPVLYDTGDLVDDYVVDPVLRNDLGGVFVVRARPGGFVGVEVHATRIRGMRASPAEGPERERMFSRFVTACRELGTEVSRESAGILHALAPARVPA